MTIRCTAVRGDRCRASGSIRRRRARIGTLTGVVRGGRRGTLRIRLTRRGLVRLTRTRRLNAVVVAGSTSLSGRRERVGGPVLLALRTVR